MSGVKWSPVAGAGAVGMEAPQGGDDHVPSLKAKVEKLEEVESDD
jgi:hypothetical protein